jgi:hypothetical protein
MRPPPQTQEECLLWAKYGCKRGNNCSLTLYIHEYYIPKKRGKMVRNEWKGMLIIGDDELNGSRSCGAR